MLNHWFCWGRGGMRAGPPIPSSCSQHSLLSSFSWHSFEVLARDWSLSLIEQLIKSTLPPLPLSGSHSLCNYVPALITMEPGPKTWEVTVPLSPRSHSNSPTHREPLKPNDPCLLCHSWAALVATACCSSALGVTNSLYGPARQPSIL